MMNFLSHQTPFINTSWVVAHNSFANKEDGWRINAQQTYNLNSLFDKGVRGFTIDIHYHSNEISLCHETSPRRETLDKCSTTQWILFSPVVKLESFLITLHNIIVQNPNEIIILFLESYVPMQEVATLFAKSNLSQFILKTNPNNPNLTIGNILTQKTPLIVFSDYSHSDNKYLIDGFFHTKYFKESKYNLAEYRDCEDREELSRTKYNEKEYEGQEINLFLLNHFYKTSLNLKLPGTDTFYSINTYQSIKERSTKCQKEFSLFPNFIAVDYVEEGDWGGVFAYVNEQNYKMLCALTNNDCADTHQKLESLGKNVSNHQYDEL